MWLSLLDVFVTELFSDFEEIMSKRKSGGASTTNKRFQERYKFIILKH